MSENVNTTMNGTQPTSCPSNPTAEKIGMTFAYCLVFIVSLSGNTAIGIIIVYKTQTMRKPINFFIVSMAMSDLLVSIVWIPRGVQMLYVDSWLIGGPLGQALCRLVDYFLYVSSDVYIQSLVLTAVDRVGAVVFPHRYPPISSKLCPFFTLATWIVAMAVNSPGFFIRKLVEYPEKLVCEQQWNEAFGNYSSYKNYVVSTLVVFIFIPLVLIAILYIITYLKLKSQKILDEQLADAGQKRQQREQNVLKMATPIVLGFAVCWLPLGILWCIVFLASDVIIWPNCGDPHFFSVVDSMALVYCAINPCICFIFSRNYRKEIHALLRKCF